MAKLKFKKGKKYTFSDYFYFSNPPEDIAAEFDYQFKSQFIEFSVVEKLDVKKIERLKQTFYRNLSKISLTSEMAKRDFMISPLLWELIQHIQVKMEVEYSVEINDKLGGELDYLLHTKQALIIIEAKKSDISKGFNQLIVELIAMDKYQEQQKTSNFIYGAISMGELWRFGILDKQKKLIQQDLHTYRVPEDIHDLFSIIIGIFDVKIADDQHFKFNL